MAHPTLASATLAFLIAFAALGQTPDHYDFAFPAPSQPGTTAVPVRIAAVDAAGQPVANWNRAAKLGATTFGPAPVVVSEIGGDFLAIEFTNTGDDPADLSGWELESIPASFPFTPALRRRIGPGSVLPPRSTLVWSSRPGASDSWPNLASPIPFHRAGASLGLVQLRDAGGRTVDEVALPGNRATTDGLWRGNFPFPGDLKTNRSSLRSGPENHFQGGDWSVGPANLGSANPGLLLPWPGPRSRIDVVPGQIAFASGVWTGTLDVAIAGRTVVLQLDDGNGSLAESPRFAGPGLFPLVLEMDSGPTRFSEAHAGTVATARVSLPAPTPTNLVVRIAVDAPGEFAVPTTATIPAGAATATFALTNLDDAVADGTALVMLSVAATGYTPAELRLTNEDDEAGNLSLRLPAGTHEGAGYLNSPGVVILEFVPLHDVEIQLSADPILSVPSRLVVPAGHTSAPFPIWVGDDAFVDPAGRRATVTATTAGWTGNSASMPVTDDEDPAMAIAVPPQLVEGESGTVRVGFRLPRDRDTKLEITHDPRLTVPAEVVLPAGSTNVEFSVTVPATVELDPPVGSRSASATDTHPPAGTCCCSTPSMTSFT